eukprot:COSAG06_NODE_49498_length_325_cov_0.628319_1_plen_25_part_01
MHGCTQKETVDGLFRWAQGMNDAAF